LTRSNQKVLTRLAPTIAILALLLVGGFFAFSLSGKAAASSGTLTPSCPAAEQDLGCVDYTLYMCDNTLSAGNQPGTSCNIEPTDVFPNPVDYGIYVSDSNSSFSPSVETAIMDPSSNLLVGGILGSNGTYLPSQSVFDSTNDRIYVAAYYGYPYAVNAGTMYVEYVYVLDAATGAPMANITIGTSTNNQNQGWGIALDPNNGYLYADVYTSTSGNVTVISTATDSVVTTIQGLGTCNGSSCAPSGILYDPASDRVFVGHHDAANITLIDPGSNSVVGSITNFNLDSSVSPSSFAYDPQDGLVYASDYDSTVTVLGAKNDSIIFTFGEAVVNQQTSQITYLGGAYNGTSPWGIAYLPSVDYIYVANQGTDNVTVIDCATNTIVGSIAVGSLPEGIAYDKQNGFIYVADAASDTISIIGPATVAAQTTSTTTQSSSSQTSTSSVVSSSTASASQSSSTAGSSTSGSAGGIPEFPPQIIAAAAVVFAIVAAYAAARRRR
jgi:YVTN family beta-propeller protein